jgi:AraC-like DNA-binding protein
MEPRARLQVLSFPYASLEPLEGGRAQMNLAARSPGSALVWEVGPKPLPDTVEFVRSRPGGLSLVAVLPEASVLDMRPEILAPIQACRPHALLPHHTAAVDTRAVTAALRRPPLDLGADVTDYLGWRGIALDTDTTRVVRRIIELSGEVRTITDLARHLYMSRRALGRRFETRGLPVPSHWLQLARILRLASRLQNTTATVVSIAYESGYPDGFSLSNQMHRLIGFRPSQVRDFLGWEWILEAWLRGEAEHGGLNSRAQTRRDGTTATEPATPPSLARPSGQRRSGQPRS